MWGLTRPRRGAGYGGTTLGEERGAEPEGGSMSGEDVKNDAELKTPSGLVQGCGAAGVGGPGEGEARGRCETGCREGSCCPWQLM